MSSIRLEGVVKRFYQRKALFPTKGENSSTILALDHVYLDIKERETLGVIGPTGCGKTTLLKKLLQDLKKLRRAGFILTM